MKQDVYENTLKAFRELKTALKELAFQLQERVGDQDRTHQPGRLEDDVAQVSTVFVGDLFGGNGRTAVLTVFCVNQCDALCPGARAVA